MKTTCNNCLDELEAESGSIQTVKIDGLEIQFFSCPSCGRKYVLFASDDEMKKMVVARSLLRSGSRRPTWESSGRARSISL